MAEPESRAGNLVPLSPDEIVNRPFPTSFRGLAEGEVRAWLARVAEQVAVLRDRERALVDENDRLQHQVSAPPAVTEQQLVAALGDETSRVLRSAQDAAADIRRKAEERSVRIVRETQEEAKRLREEAERLLGARSLEAEDAAAEILRDSQARAAEVRAEAAAELASAKERVLRETADEIVAAKERAKQIVDEAHALRDKLVGDLGKRRTLLMAQIDELRAGRERLLEAYRTVKRTLDEATRALSQVETRAAAELGAREHDEITPITPARDEPSPLGGVGIQRAAGTPSSPPPVSSGTAGQATRPVPPPRPSPRSAPPLPPRPVGSPEGPAVRVLGPRPPEPAPSAVEPAPSAVEPAGVAPSSGEPPPTELTSLAAASAEPETPGQPEAPEPPVATGRISPFAPHPSTRSPETAPDPSDAPFAPPPRAVPDAPAPVAPAPPPVREQASRNTQDDIEALFARIRAARDEALAEYDEPAAASTDAGEIVATTVTTPPTIEPTPAAAEPAPVVPAPTAPTATAPAATLSSAALEATAPAAPEVEQVPDVEPVPVVDARTEALLARRDVTLDPLATSLAKRLKRTLQDEQNAVLDALRTLRGEPTADTLLPGVHEHVASYVSVAVDSLAAAYSAGVRSAGGDPERDAGAELGALIENFARSIAVPLRERISSGLSEAVRHGEDETGVADRLNARYREWKVQRIETTVRDGLTAAFAMGVYDATPPGETLRWLVDDDGPCPDCDDNSLEATPRGMPFPTGQVFPPAHPGCRCLIVGDRAFAD